LFAYAADDTATGAVAAIGRASISDQEQDAIWVSVDEPWDRHLGVFAAGIGHLGRGPVGLFDAGDNLATNRTVWVFWVDEIEKMWCHRKREFVSGQNYAGALFGGKGDLLLKLLQVSDSVFKLPFPVIPVLRFDLGPKAWSEGKEPLIGGFG